MKLKQYLKELNKLIKDNPEALNMEVVYSIDDEGNGFQKVEFAPGLGNFEGRYKGEFTTKDELRDEKINAICIN